MKTICLTESIKKWDEPKSTLLKVKNLLKPYIGKKVIVWGGGGYGGSFVTLKRVTIHPTILRDREGYTLKVWLTDCEPSLSTYGNPGKFSPWIGSWQISVEAVQ